MSAVGTALRVLRWARAPIEAPPAGGLLDPDGLCHPSASLISEAGALAAIIAARWQLTPPPFGDGRAPGPGAMWLAAVVGGRDAAGRDHLLGGCPTPTGAWDLIVRDAVCRPALAHVEPSTADALRARSPLTGALDRPAPGGVDGALGLIDRLRKRADGRRLLIRALAASVDDLAVLRWRAEVLDRLRLAGAEGRAFVYEVYEAALVLYRDEALARAARAEQMLRCPPADEAALDGALALAAWWGPLWALRRSHGEEIKHRSALDVDGLLNGTRLHGLSRQLGGIAA